MAPYILFRLAMQGMLAAARTEFAKFYAARVIPAILLSSVIAFFAL